jgi:DNA-binding NarL/FixJ family response regulator
MSRVLVIDDDAGTLLGYKSILRAVGYEVATAALGEDGMAAAQREQFDAVICDQRLPDRPGIEIVRQIHDSCPRTAIVFLTAWSTPELVIEAKRAGATSYAEKPLAGDDLVALVDDAVRQHADNKVLDPNPIGHAARRWADLVIRGVYLPDDPKTTLLLCRGVAVSHSTLQKRCEAVGVKPKAALDLVRLIRVVIHHAGDAWDLERWLEIVDDRTARSLMERSGLAASGSRVPNLETFWSLQRLIAAPELIAALRIRLLRRFQQ